MNIFSSSGSKWYRRESVDKYAHDRPAIYFLGWYQKNSGYKIKYVGETAVLGQRLNRHKGVNWWNCFTWENASNSKREREKRETELIKKLNPPKNDRISAKTGAKKAKPKYGIDVEKLLFGERR